MKYAGVYSYWTVGELGDAVSQFSLDGYRIVHVFQTDNGMFHLVVQEF